jgi:hypothetical protein
MPDNISDKPPRQWYKKKRYLIPLGVIALVALINITENKNLQPAVQSQVQSSNLNQPAVGQLPQSAPPETVKPVTPPQQAAPAPIIPSTPVPAPTPAPKPTPPPAPSSSSDHVGASARCSDGSYSYSAHRQGTCSHHGGVAIWY